jgi:hypothetical protein
MGGKGGTTGIAGSGPGGTTGIAGSGPGGTTGTGGTGTTCLCLVGQHCDTTGKCVCDQTDAQACTAAGVQCGDITNSCGQAVFCACKTANTICDTSTNKCVTSCTTGTGGPPVLQDQQIICPVSTQ